MIDLKMSFRNTTLPKYLHMDLIYDQKKWKKTVVDSFYNDLKLMFSPVYLVYCYKRQCYRNILLAVLLETVVAFYIYRAFATQAEGYVFESQPRRTIVTNRKWQLQCYTLSNSCGCHGSLEMNIINAVY